MYWVSWLSGVSVLQVRQRLVSISATPEGRSGDALELLAEEALLRLDGPRPRLENLGDDASLELRACVGDPRPRLLSDGDTRLRKESNRKRNDVVQHLKVRLRNVRVSGVPRASAFWRYSPRAP